MHYTLLKYISLSVTIAGLAAFLLSTSLAVRDFRNHDTARMFLDIGLATFNLLVARLNFRNFLEARYREQNDD